MFMRKETMQVMKMIDKSNLKKCPFCGGEVYMKKSLGITNFLCDLCGAVVSFRGSEGMAEAKSMWNTRMKGNQC